VSCSRDDRPRAVGGSVSRLSRLTESTRQIDECAWQTLRCSEAYGSRGAATHGSQRSIRL